MAVKWFLQGTAQVHNPTVYFRSTSSSHITIRHAPLNRQTLWESMTPRCV